MGLKEETSPLRTLLYDSFLCCCCHILTHILEADVLEVVVVVVMSNYCHDYTRAEASLCACCSRYYSTDHDSPCCYHNDSDQVEDWGHYSP